MLLPVRDEARAHRPGAARPCWPPTHVPALEIVVLDDDSTDGTADLVRGSGRRRPAAAGGLQRHRAAAGLAGQAVRLRAARRARRPGQHGAGLPRRRRRARPRRPEPHRPAAPRGRARLRLARTRARWPGPWPSGWSSPCCSGPGSRSCRCGWPSTPRGRRWPSRTASCSPSTPRSTGAAAATPRSAARCSRTSRSLACCARAGGHGGMADGTDVADCRMYGGGRELRDGYAQVAVGGAAARRPRSAAQVRPAARASTPGRTRSAAPRGRRAGLVAARRTGGRALAGRAGPPGSRSLA